MKKGLYAFSHINRRIVGKKKRYAMVIDLRRCVGCHTCSIACKSENKVPLHVFRSWVKQIEKGEYPEASISNLPRLCNHCVFAPCVLACPTKASYQREDGIVLIHYERCIGCKACITACPYDARFIHPVDHVAGKCTFCEHKVAGGHEPACVAACPSRARIFGELNDPDSQVSKIVSTTNVVVLRPEARTEPMVFYVAPDSNVMMRTKEKIGVE